MRRNFSWKGNKKETEKNKLNKLQLRWHIVLLQATSMRVTLPRSDNVVITLETNQSDGVTTPLQEYPNCDLLWPSGMPVNARTCRNSWPYLASYPCPLIIALPDTRSRSPSKRRRQRQCSSIGRAYRLDNARARFAPRYIEIRDISGCSKSEAGQGWRANAITTAAWPYHGRFAGRRLAPTSLGSVATSARAWLAACVSCRTF